MNRIRLDTSNFHLKFKNSMFCGLKGFLIFSLAGTTLFHNSSHSMFFGKESRFSLSENENYRISHGNIKSQLKNNVVPFCEAVIVMPLVFIATHFIGNAMGAEHNFTMYMICSAVCMAIMLVICLTLRLLQKRKDSCCDHIEHPIYRNPNCNDNSFINFTDPTDSSSKTSSKKSLSALKSLFSKKSSTKSAKAKSIVFSVLMAPVTAIKATLELCLLTIEMLELPFSLILDALTMTYEIATQGNATSQFDHSRKSVERMCSLLYSGIRDLIVTGSLGILQAEIITQKHCGDRSPISLLDQIFTESHVNKTEEHSQRSTQGGTKKTCCSSQHN